MFTFLNFTNASKNSGNKNYEKERQEYNVNGHNEKKIENGKIKILKGRKDGR
jgi:hypothetical protein